MMEIDMLELATLYLHFLYIVGKSQQISCFHLAMQRSVQNVCIWRGFICNIVPSKYTFGHDFRIFFLFIIILLGVWSDSVYRSYFLEVYAY